MIHDITRANSMSPEIEKELYLMFDYRPWDETKIGKGKKVKDALIAAVKIIIENVPPSPDRSAAIRKIREARMDCNSAITHNGAY